MTRIPNTIRYQPNTLKSCFLIYPIKNLIAKIETKNATNVPVPSVIASAAVNQIRTSPFLINLHLTSQE